MLKQLTIGAALACAVGCATAPETRVEQKGLEQRASAALTTMKARDARLDEILSRSAGYAVFPEIGKGGAIVGGAYGHGVVYQHGRPVGYVELSQASIGAQLGGQTFAELIVLRDHKALERLKSDNLDLGADISAVALTTGAAGSAQFEKGVAVYVMPRGGLMVDLSVNGQKIDYRRKPAG
ncbi:MAG TPA: lipid-binding SYLF domain-containing protein [Kofleriaceae bacterium]|nr:lipid-binding SYLF domain-containing protein [Kofleriaceae bacterium]